jgi:hypothetical protein
VAAADIVDRIQRVLVPLKPHATAASQTRFLWFFYGGQRYKPGWNFFHDYPRIKKMGGVQSPPLLESSSHSVIFKPAPLPLSLGTVILVQNESTAPPPPVPPPPAPLVTSIKDKPSDMGLKDITDKNSWIKAKAVIDSRLHRAPFWLGPTSKAFITMSKNIVASTWLALGGRSSYTTISSPLFAISLWRNLDSMGRVLK